MSSISSSLPLQAIMKSLLIALASSLVNLFLCLWIHLEAFFMKTLAWFLDLANCNFCIDKFLEILKTSSHYRRNLSINKKNLSKFNNIRVKLVI